MKREKALKALENITVDYENRTPDEIAELNEAMDMAISALKAQQAAGDTISRKAAIDALEKVAELFPWRVPGNRDSYDYYNEAWNDAIGRAEIEIEKLPSAQPVDEAYLIDWYISSVDDSDPVWTEAHIEELMNDFYLIPKGCIDG